MASYYNECEPYAVEWLHNLIMAGLIPPGEVDERSIEEVAPNDLQKFTQAHGVPARVGKLRAAGNAIAPQVAAAFMKAYMKCRP